MKHRHNTVVKRPCDPTTRPRRLCRGEEEESLRWHQQILQNAEEVVQALELPYRVVNVCDGDLGRGHAVYVIKKKEMQYKKNKTKQNKDINVVSI